jgi:hypothetical protein
MKLNNGIYQTAAGSVVSISGEHGGRSVIDFDWLEEGACCDCMPEPYEQDGILVWHCDECGGGSASLVAVPNAI